MSRYTIYPGTTLLLEPRYCGSIGWYGAMAAHEHCIVDYGARFDKRHKLTHRTTIADVNGRLDLTVPVSHTRRLDTEGDRHPLTWHDITLSSHGDWWNVHRVALESSYGRTPYFEFYIDRFLPVYRPDVVERMVTLENINRHIDREVRLLLDLPTEDAEVPTGEIIDMRNREPEPVAPIPYYQVRASRLGFIAGLSILDLLFNMGPEAKLYLYKAIRAYDK